MFTFEDKMQYRIQDVSEEIMKICLEFMYSNQLNQTINCNVDQEVELMKEIIAIVCLWSEGIPQKVFPMLENVFNV